MISLSKKFLFVHMPKTGGNSVQNILKEYANDEITTDKARQDGVERFDILSEIGTTKHAKLFDYKGRMEANVYNSLFKFSIVRNPWDRAISSYFFKYFAAELAKGRKAEEVEEPVFIAEDFIYWLQRVPRLEDMLLHDESNSKIDFINDTDLDFFMKTETLQKDLDFLCEKLGIKSQTLAVRNKSVRGEYTKYYDENLKSIIANRYKNEIEFFEYEF
jgi:hypothetical protein